MKRFSLSLLILCLAAACATTPSDSTTAGNGALGGAIRATDATHYRLLSDARHIRDIDWANPPQALHVKGRMTNVGFQPIGGVEGRGKLCTDGQDWVSIADGQFHSAQEGTAPQGPYVKGCKTKMGSFVPASRELAVQ